MNRGKNKNGKDGSENFPYENISRYTTDEEKKEIIGITLDDEDVERLILQFRNSLQHSALAANGAVQDNSTIFAEVSLRLSRNVQSKDGSRIEQLVSRDTVEGEVGFKKEYKK